MNKEVYPLDHLAFIMDGNGRWAKKQGKNRFWGYEIGLKVARTLVLSALDKKIPFVSLYVFSTENWKRSTDEVGYLMSLIVRYLKSEMLSYKQYGIRIIHSGDKTKLPRNVQNVLEEVIDYTQTMDKLCLNLAINYGGRAELLRAISRIPKDKIQNLDEDEFRNFLDQPFIPDIDLLIRTGNEYRLSNFFLWQSAYSQIYFSQKHWPEWTDCDLNEAIEWYATQTRRFGA